MQTVQTDTSRAATPVIQWCLVKWNAKKKLNVCKENLLDKKMKYDTKNYVLLESMYYERMMKHSYMKPLWLNNKKKFKETWKRLK